MERRRSGRFVAAILAAVITAQAGLADAATSTLWSQRRRPVETPVAPAVTPREPFAAINPAHGSVRRLRAPEGIARGQVLIVQDIHLQLEAQTNISKALIDLLSRRSVDLVAIEGSSRALPIDHFRASPDPESLRLAADFLLREGRISGAVHAALSARHSAALSGIDDDRLHAANADAYRRSRGDRARFEAAIAGEKARVDRKKPAVFGATLAAFDARVAARRAEEVSFADHVPVLTGTARRLGLPVPAALAGFSEAAAIEASLDAGRVQTERDALLTRLAGRLPAGDAAALMRAGIAFRSRQMDHAAFFQRFESACARAGLAVPTELRRYFRYLSLADRVDGAAVLASAASLERSIFSRLAASAAERALIDADRSVHLAAKLSRFALTRDEWEEWTASRIPLDGSAWFETFYSLATERDRSLSDNLVARLRAGGGATAVAVVGGFHVNQVAETLANRGYVVDAFTPSLTRAGNGSDYLSVFSREKTPLEKLFDGQKLFLASDAMSDAAGLELATLTIGRATALGRAGDFGGWLRRTLKLVLIEAVRRSGGARLVIEDRNAARHAIDVGGVTSEGFSERPRAAAPTGTYALGRALFGPFTSRWPVLTVRLAWLLELPQIYLSAFSLRFRDAFLTPSWNLSQKREALARIHNAMAFAGAAGVATGLLGFALAGAGVPSIAATLVSGAAWATAGALAFSVVPATVFHALSETRLTEGDPGSYAARLLVYLAGLEGPPNNLDPNSSAFHQIAQETEALLRDAGQTPSVHEAWLEAAASLRGPFEDFLTALFIREAYLDPDHLVNRMQELVVGFTRFKERGETGELIDFVSRTFGRAAELSLLLKKDEHYARDSAPIRVLEVTPEVRPFRMVGGMGVVNGTLPNEMNRFHAQATTVSLYYDDGNYDQGLPYTAQEKLPFTVTVTIAGEKHVGEVHHVRRRNDDGSYADFYFLKDTFAGAHNTTTKPYLAGSGTELGIKQAVFLSEGALQLMKELHARDPLKRKFDVVRAHDWQAALAAIYLKTRPYAEDPAMREAISNATPMAFFHNLEPNYRGEFNIAHWHLLGLDDVHKQAFGWERVENGPEFSHVLVGYDEKAMSIGKALAHHVEGMFVPAPTYAEMIQTEEYGYDMASMFRARAHVLKGVLNGGEYDPADEMISPMGKRAAGDFLVHRRLAKEALLRETGMWEKIEEEVRSRLGEGFTAEAFNAEMNLELDRPVITAVVRLDPKMKGVWFYRTVADRLTREANGRHVRVVILGVPLDTPESKDFVRQMTELADELPDRVAFFPTGRKPLSRDPQDIKLGGASLGMPTMTLADVKLGGPIRTLNDLVQTGGDIGMYPSKVEPCGLADVESANRGAVLIVSDKGGFNDKARDLDVQGAGEPTGVVFTGAYDDHEGMVHDVRRLLDVYDNDRARFDRIAASNKNLRFTMRRMARSHVTAIASLIKRVDVEENPEKPARRGFGPPSPFANGGAANGPAEDDDFSRMLRFFGERYHLIPPMALIQAGRGANRAASKKAVNDLARMAVEGETEDDRMAAAASLHMIAGEDRSRLTALAIDRLAAGVRLERFKPARETLMGILTKFALLRPDLISTRVVTTAEFFLSSPRQSHPEYRYAALQLVSAVAASPALASDRTVDALSRILQRSGLSGGVYDSVAEAAMELARLRPDLVDEGSILAAVARADDRFQRRSWAFWPVVASGALPRTLSEEDRFSVATAAWQALLRSGLEPTRINARRAVRAVMAMRKDRADAVLIGKSHKVITIAHEEARFSPDRQRRLARVAGVPESNIVSPFKGPDDRDPALATIASMKGPYAVIFHGHGNPGDLALGGETGISVTALSDALLATAVRTDGGLDLSHVTLIIDACRSYNFAEEVYYALGARGVTRTPSMVATTHRDADAFGSAGTELLAGASRPGTGLRVADVFAAERLGFHEEEFVDFALFLPDPIRLPGGPRVAGEIGLAWITARLLGLAGIRRPGTVALVGALLESLFVVAAVPAVLLLFGVDAGVAVGAAKLVAFPALHLFGVMAVVKDPGSGVTLIRAPPSAGRLLRLALLGAAIHVLLPAGLGIAAHLIVNSIAVKPPLTPEQRIRRELKKVKGTFFYPAGGADWKPFRDYLPRMPNVTNVAYADREYRDWFEKLPYFKEGRAKRLLTDAGFAVEQLPLEKGADRVMVRGHDGRTWKVAYHKVDLLAERLSDVMVPGTLERQGGIGFAHIERPGEGAALAVGVNSGPFHAAIISQVNVGGLLGGYLRPAEEPLEFLRAHYSAIGLERLGKDSGGRLFLKKTRDVPAGEIARLVRADRTLQKLFQAVEYPYAFNWMPYQRAELKKALGELESAGFHLIVEDVRERFREKFDMQTRTHNLKPGVLSLDDDEPANSLAPAAGDDEPFEPEWRVLNRLLRLRRQSIQPVTEIWRPAVKEIAALLSRDEADVRRSAAETLMDVLAIAPSHMTRAAFQAVARALEDETMPEATNALLKTVLEATIMRPDLIGPATLRRIISRIEGSGMEDEEYVLAITSIRRILGMAPDMATTDTVSFIEGAMLDVGFAPKFYEAASDALEGLKRLRPGLFRGRKLSSAILKSPAPLRRHSWSFWPIIKLGAIPEHMNAYDAFSVATAAHQALERSGLRETAANARNAVEAVLERRLAENDRVLVGSGHRFVIVAHEEPRFAVARSAYLARRAGVRDEDILSFKGRGSREAVLRAIAGIHGPYAVSFDGHGTGSTLLLAEGDPIGYRALGNALLPTATGEAGERDLSHATLFIGSCYSHDFAVNLDEYLMSKGVIRLPSIVTSAHKHRLAYGGVTTALILDAIDEDGLRISDIFAAERTGFHQRSFTDFTILVPDPIHLPGAKKPVLGEIGLSSLTVGVLGLFRVRGAMPAAILGAILESLFILVALPAAFAAMGVGTGTIVELAMLIGFPALHLSGAMKAVRDPETGTRLVRTRPASAAFLRLLIMGAVVHLILPGGSGILAHAALNAAIVLLAPAPVERRLARSVARAAAESVSGRNGAAWAAAMRALVDGRALSVGARQFGGKAGAALVELDGDDFDIKAFHAALAAELEALGLRNAVAPEAAWDAAGEVALAGLARAPLDRAIADMDRDGLNVIVAESLPEEALPKLIARLRADPDLRAVLLLKAGSARSAAVAAAMASMPNVAPETPAGVFELDGPGTTVSLAGLDRLLDRRGGAVGKVHVFAGRDVRFDAAGLKDGSALRAALYTILDALAVTTTFPRIGLMDALYRLMSSQA